MNPSVSARMIGFLVLALVILCNVAGNVLLKQGADDHAHRVLFGIFSARSAAGIGCFGLSVLFYAWALKHVELHVAQIVVSVQYIAVILAAAFLLGEHVTTAQWCGMALIAAGILVCLR
jgi:drug/metabolite transporter (DMT)-like permease